MAKVLRRVRERSVREALCWELDVDRARATLPGVTLSDRLEVNEASCSDDATFPIIAPASQLCRRLSKQVEILHEEFARHGVELNLGLSKTAVIARCFGEGSVAARDQLEGEHGKEIIFKTRQGLASVDVVRRCTSLGTFTNDKGNVNIEIRHRIGVMHAATQRLRKRFLHSQ